MTYQAKAWLILTLWLTLEKELLWQILKPVWLYYSLSWEIREIIMAWWWLSLSLLFKNTLLSPVWSSAIISLLRQTFRQYLQEEIGSTMNWKCKNPKHSKMKNKLSSKLCICETMQMGCVYQMFSSCLLSKSSV